MYYNSLLIMGVLLFACGWQNLVWGNTSTELGLPPMTVAPDNPQTPGEILLGERLFNDACYRSTGAISCATRHDA